ncbi:MAG: DUF58 domain-containing protein [bacterium]|nr:DUF58 domain-containing protein [bacterium]
MWENLPLIIKKRVRQREGDCLASSLVDEDGFEPQGMREFSPDDPPRALSVRDYLRTGQMVVVEKHPDRNALVLFLVDVSASEFLGSARLKHAASLDVMRGLATACLARNFTIVVFAFTTRVEFESHPIRSMHALESVIAQIEVLALTEKKTDPSSALNRAWDVAMRPQDPADLICIVSDFLFPNTDTTDLEMLADACDVIAVALRDPLEESLPPFAGGVMLRDAETGATSWASSVGDYDPLPGLERVGIDACLLRTSESDVEHYEKLSDFFETRREEI